MRLLAIAAALSAADNGHTVVIPEGDGDPYCHFTCPKQMDDCMSLLGAFNGQVTVGH